MRSSLGCIAKRKALYVALDAFATAVKSADHQKIIEVSLAHFGHITAGDLSRPVEIRSRDEMGQLLSGIAKMPDGLAQAVLSVRTGSEVIRDVVATMSEIIRDI